MVAPPLVSRRAPPDQHHEGDGSPHPGIAPSLPHLPRAPHLLGQEIGGECRTRRQQRHAIGPSILRGVCTRCCAERRKLKGAGGQFQELAQPRRQSGHQAAPTHETHLGRGWQPLNRDGGKEQANLSRELANPLAALLQAAIVVRHALQAVRTLALLSGVRGASQIGRQRLRQVVSSKQHRAARLDRAFGAVADSGR